MSSQPAVVEPVASHDGPQPWVSLTAPYWTAIDIGRFEEHYRVSYIGDFCIRDGQGRWTEEPVAVFYNAAPDVSQGHRHYLGAFVRDGAVFLCDASIVAQVEWNAAIADSGEIIISTYRHDYRVSADGTAMVDGGQDYCRMGGSNAPVRVRIDGAAMASANARLGSGKVAIQGEMVTTRAALPAPD